MRDRAALLLDRHVFASSASVFDTAWETVAASPALAGERAGRLEERIPWATELADRPDAPVLAGEESALSPLAELPLSYLPLDSRTGLCVSGVVDVSYGEGRGTGRPRVATHTLLFDESSFRQIAGFPLGLFSEGAAGVTPSTWFRDFRLDWIDAGSEVPPVRIASEERVARTFERARVAAVGALSGRLRRVLGEEVAVGVLASAFRALAGNRGGEGKTVVVGGPEVAGGPWVREAVLLTWLSLPLADRHSVYFSTTEVDIGGVSPLLTAGPGSEVHGLDDGRLAVVSLNGAGPVEDGFRAWARTVFEGGDSYSRASRRLDSRGWSLIDSGPFPVVPRPVPMGGEAFRRWFEEEAGGLGRMRGVGWVTGRTLGTLPAGERRSLAAWLLADAPLTGDARFWDGFVRGMLGWEDLETGSPEEARLAVRAGLASSRRGIGLQLAVQGLEALIRDGGGFRELVTSVETLTRSEGEASGIEMWRLGFGLLRRWRRVKELPAYLAVLTPTGPVGGGIAADVADLLREAPSREVGWEGAMSALWSRLVGSADPGDDRVHRLAWEEYGRFGETALARLARGGDGDVLRFTRAFLAEDPPLPVFLELRRATAGVGGMYRGGGG